MVKLRLSRFGHKNAPFYRIVAANARSKREGNSLEFVGTYDPKTTPKKITLDKEKIELWLKNGAVPTATVRMLLIKEGVLKKEVKTAKVYANKPGKKKQARAAKAAK
jgi:small subunit ribosomal protein S16